MGTPLRRRPVYTTKQAALVLGISEPSATDRFKRRVEKGDVLGWSREDPENPLNQILWDVERTNALALADALSAGKPRPTLPDRGVLIEVPLPALLGDDAPELSQVAELDPVLVAEASLREREVLHEELATRELDRAREERDRWRADAEDLRTRVAMAEDEASRWRRVVHELSAGAPTT